MHTVYQLLCLQRETSESFESTGAVKFHVTLASMSGHKREDIPFCMRRRGLLVT